MPADTRDSFMLHTMLRREFAALPDLVRAVTRGNVERAQVVADHLEFLVGVLIGHHRAEDERIWPALADRAGAQLDAIPETMRQQHACIEELSDQVMTTADGWCRDNASPARRDMLAESLDALVELLHEHMAMEEVTAIPLAGCHLSDAEWAEMGSYAAAGMPGGTMDLIFGMTLYEAAPQDVTAVLSGLPPVLRAILVDEARRVYADYATHIHGTATPQRSRPVRS
ncbi:hemerythrin domain-containing protein [Actinoplanes sp. TBRC 11911]|uniref:hemerythrin domain-containing protein n=1 Tax=Actinoplanes sp. TBRC 11911 TaxID=2729386 RepID=UPI00145D7EE1|nr:hemerythrin domain-containing protein [Actinoplanes sp. TBRC 11911]NMO52791.1 hemerythrin domain-containing protein [Actinoplanes sp. TBRC 11911]